MKVYSVFVLTLSLLLTRCMSSAQGASPAPITTGASPAFTTTQDYVSHFYPLWFSYHQFQHTSSDHNHLVGPDHISNVYQSVVAVNDDTLYASTFLDLRAQPVILTVPATTATYSLLTLDPYGDIFTSGIPALTPGTFALVGPGFSGTLPGGVTPITMPLNISVMIFRVDKFSAAGVDQTTEASTFRASLNMQALCDFENTSCPGGVAPDTTGGNTSIEPEILFATPFKLMADTGIATDPITFLQQLQTAVAAPNTPPLSPAEQTLSDTFNSLLNSTSNQSQLAAGARAAHAAIVSDYLKHTISGTQWIHFTNIGNWGDAFLDRSAITEFLQYSNGITTAAYYHTFNDANGSPLDGSTGHVYVLTFPAGQLPMAQRFWSLTAYTPRSIELINNPENTYVVASYTPGLTPNPDGSVSIYMAQTLPAGVPMANFLPISTAPFNIMLRVYGPEGNVADNTFVPPPISKLK